MPIRAPTLFIPVATPGIGEPGHLFRTDGTVLMPLHAVQGSGLPSLAQVLADIERSLSGAHGGAPAGPAVVVQHANGSP